MDSQIDFKDVDGFVNADQLRSYVKTLLQEINSNHSLSHPAILKGEKVDNIV
jgi:hypothetical protein